MECVICGGNAASEEFCFFCWYTGRYFEKVLLSDERSNLLGQIREMEHVSRAEVWHQGGGMFALAIELDDGKVLLPGIPIDVNGRPGTMPGIPPVGTEWGVTVAASQQADQLTQMPDRFDDDGLVRTVKELSEFGAALA